MPSQEIPSQFSMPTSDTGGPGFFGEYPNGAILNGTNGFNGSQNGSQHGSTNGNNSTAGFNSDLNRIKREVSKTHCDLLGLNDAEFRMVTLNSCQCKCRITKRNTCLISKKKDLN
jgi:hypothetical protein